MDILIKFNHLKDLVSLCTGDKSNKAFLIEYIGWNHYFVEFRFFSQVFCSIVDFSCLSDPGHRCPCFHDLVNSEFWQWAFLFCFCWPGRSFFIFMFWLSISQDFFCFSISGYQFFLVEGQNLTIIFHLYSCLVVWTSFLTPYTTHALQRW